MVLVDRRPGQRRGEETQLLQGQSTRCFCEHLDADMACARRAVFVDTRRNSRLIAQHDERVDQSIASATGDFIVGEPESSQCSCSWAAESSWPGWRGRSSSSIGSVSSTTPCSVATSASGPTASAEDEVLRCHR